MGVFDPYTFANPVAGLPVPHVDAPSATSAGGLLGGLQGLLKKASTPDEDGNTFWDRLGTFGASLQDASDGGDRAAKLAQAAQSRAQSKADADKQAQMMAVANQLNMTPREKLIFLANPDKWAEQNATRLAFHDLPGGNTGSYGDPNNGGYLYTAPKLVNNDNVFGTQTPDGVAQTGALGMSDKDRAALLTAQNGSFKSVPTTDNLVNTNPSGQPVGVAPQAGNLNSYRDPGYSPIEQQVAQQTGVPANLLAAIRTAGERSNADQTSSEGAKSVYQITPATRAAVLKNYGVDAYAGPAQAAQAAALVLKESLARHNGDMQSAVREYIGGTDPNNYGPVTKAYVGRVMGAVNAPAPAQASQAPQIVIAGVPKPDAKAGEVPADQKKAIDDLNTELENKRILAERAALFMNYQRAHGVNTGPAFGDIMGVHGLNFSGVGLPGGQGPQQRQSLDSISNQTWPLLRPVGSGPMRNQEVEAFKKAFPSTANYAEANADAAQRLQDEYQQHLALTQYVRQYVAAGKGGVADAIAAFNAQGAPKPPPALTPAPLPAPAPARAQQNAALIAKSAATKVAQAAPKDQFIVGKRYVDRKGNSAIYLGNGKWSG